MKLGAIKKFGLHLLVIWVLVNLPFGLLDLLGRGKSIGGYPTSSLQESESEGILVIDMTESVYFEGAIKGTTFKEAWIEKDRNLVFVVSVVPFLWSIDIWSYPAGHNFIIKQSSLGSFHLDGGASLQLRAESASQNLQGGTHYGNTRISAYRVPKAMDWATVRAVFYRSY